MKNALVRKFCPARLLTRNNANVVDKASCIISGIFKFYITVGITDMADGAEARRTGTVSEFVSRLDTAAVICMVATAAAIQEGYRISCCVEKNNAYAWNERK